METITGLFNILNMYTLICSAHANVIQACAVDGHDKHQPGCEELSWRPGWRAPELFTVQHKAARTAVSIQTREY